MSDPERTPESVTSTCNRSSSGDLPTLEYVGVDGVRRVLDFQRCPHAPWNALLVEREQRPGDEGMRHVGTEQLRELRVDGEPVTAISLVDVLEGP
ncbi:hypothetical protein ACFPM1_07885 [Halorubrum rubrum]|uniref:Uncharacterized protein n=1 Tax=Halorubrum rubrum TaxID=1126240 RepID=A0ABD5R1E9_9EURY|nr:hypothetical protein [Halorubrum rubrum]